MKLYRYAVGASVLIALAVVVFVGCGVNSGVRDENTPGYTGGPASGTPGGSREPGTTPPGGDPGDATQVEKDIFDIVNEEREKAGLTVEHEKLDRKFVDKFVILIYSTAFRAFFRGF